MTRFDARHGAFDLSFDLELLEPLFGGEGRIQHQALSFDGGESAWLASPMSPQGLSWMLNRSAGAHA